MTKNADREARSEARIEALAKEFPGSTPERRATMLHRYEGGKTGPVMKRVGRVLREQGLE